MPETLHPRIVLDLRHDAHYGNHSPVDRNALWDLADRWQNIWDTDMTAIRDRTRAESRLTAASLDVACADPRFLPLTGTDCLVLQVAVEQSGIDFRESAYNALGILAAADPGKAELSAGIVCSLATAVRMSAAEHPAPPDDLAVLFDMLDANRPLWADLDRHGVAA